VGIISGATNFPLHRPDDSPVMRGWRRADREVTWSNHERGRPVRHPFTHSFTAITADCCLQLHQVPGYIVLEHLNERQRQHGQPVRQQSVGWSTCCYLSARLVTTAPHQDLLRRHHHYCMLLLNHSHIPLVWYCFPNFRRCNRACVIKKANDHVCIYATHRTSEPGWSTTQPTVWSGTSFHCVLPYPFHQCGI